MLSRKISATSQTNRRYDVVVVGLGAMGSAAVYQLAKAGTAVLGIDRFAPPHSLGSTHGDSRITRLAIGEGLEYVPLVRRSHEIWREIESEFGVGLLQQCGGLVMAPRDSQSMHGNENFLDQTIASAEQHGIEHQRLTTAEIEQRFPQFRLAGTEEGYFEPSAGFVRPERCVDAQLELAMRLGASIRFDEPVLSYEDDGTSVRVRTSTDAVDAAQVVITAGPWVTQLVPELAGQVTVYRQVLYWFEVTDPGDYAAYRQLPVYIWWGGRGREDMVYGFPMVDGPDVGAKVAREQYSTPTTVDDVDRQVAEDEVEEMYEVFVRDRLPGLGRRCVKTRACLYSVTPGSRFIIDRHPTSPNVIVGSPCSGHGFKHSAAIGEALAQLATTGTSRLDLSAFRYPRLG